LAGASDIRVQASPTLDIPLLTLKQVYGLCNALLGGLLSAKTPHRATQLIALRLIRSGSVGFTIKVRVPPRGLNDVNLMERKIS
jgi:hypothetical protein